MCEVSSGIREKRVAQMKRKVFNHSAIIRARTIWLSARVLRNRPVFFTVLYNDIKFKHHFQLHWYVSIGH